MKYVVHGSSIECAQSEISSRDIKLSSLVDIPNVGKCRKYKCKRNSDAKILASLNPKKFIYKENSHLEINDSLSAEEIVIIINDLTTLDKTLINKSGQHKAQLMTTNCFTYGEITLQYHFLKSINDPNQFKNPSIENK
jgi:hypothetical protein